MKVLIDVDDELVKYMVNGWTMTEDQKCQFCDAVRDGRIIDDRPYLIVNGNAVYLDPCHMDALLLVDSRISFAKAINQMMENFDSKQEYDIDNMTARDLEKAFPDIPAPRYDGDKNIILYSGGY